MARKVSRRKVLLAGGKLSLAGITLGILNVQPLDLFTSQNALAAGGKSLSKPKVASFGWGIANIHNNGADAYFRVNAAMTLKLLTVDMAFVITSLPGSANFAEVLCQVGVSRGAPPTFSSGPQAYINEPASPDFGSAQFYNPNGLNIGAGGPVQDIVMAAILKTFVPTSGSGAYTSRNITVTPNLALNVGDYLMFHMDHAGEQALSLTHFG